jgi:hypothetical protein
VYCSSHFGVSTGPAASTAVTSILKEPAATAVSMTSALAVSLEFDIDQLDTPASRTLSDPVRTTARIYK